ncbi:MAG: FAD:protein FMN transferase [Melioribacteraceae bacterium]
MKDIYHNSFFSMGTRFNVVFPFCNDDLGEHIFSLIKNELNRIESKYSYFDRESFLFRINKSAYLNEFWLDEETYDLLSNCRECNSLTNGKFDITLRPVIESLNEEKSENENIQLGSNLGFKNIIINDKNKSIRFENEFVKIDFGAIGKGYGLHKISNYLDDYEIKDVFISFGGSSILTKGKHPNGDCWKVSIPDLNNQLKPSHVFNIKDGSLSISSNYYYGDNGKIRFKNSIIDPESYKPMEEKKLSAIYSSSPLEAELLSTGIMLLEKEEIEKIIKLKPELKILKINDKNGVVEKEFYE